MTISPAAREAGEKEVQTFCCSECDESIQFGAHVQRAIDAETERLRERLTSTEANFRIVVEQQASERAAREQAEREARDFEIQAQAAVRVFQEQAEANQKIVEQAERERDERPSRFLTEAKIELLEEERDQLRADLERVTRERDALKAEVSSIKSKTPQ